jgi:biotin carboxylase
MRSPKILLLGASEELVPLIHLTRERGYIVVATDRNPYAQGLRAANIPCILDGSDIEKVMALAKQHCIVGIMTRTEALLPVVAQVCRELRLPGPSPGVAELSVNKYIFRQRMQHAGLSTPPFFSPSTPVELSGGLQQTGLPVVVKPVDYGGSSGVTLVSSPEELVAAWEQARETSPSGQVIVEKRITGREFSVETWTQQGVTHITAITEKSVTDNGHFVELGHTIPARLTPDEANIISAEVLRMGDAMQLNDCLTHTEVMLTPEGKAVLIETGARPGGDLIGLRLVELATGVSMNRIMMQLAIGEKVAVSDKLHHAAAIRFITTYNKDRFHALHATITAHSHFVEYGILRNDDPGRLTSSADRLAYYLFRSDSPETLNQTLQLFDEN